MRSLIRLTLVTTLGLALLPGCALIPRFWGKKAPKQDAGKSFQLVGSIVLINAESNFVLIDSGTHASPNVDTEAEARSTDGSKVQLRVTEVRKRPFAIADIVGGTPHVGDQVYQERGKEKPAEKPTP